MKFDDLYYSILIKQDITQLNILYQNMSLAFISGSFKPPTKSDWDLIMQYLKIAKDKVIVIISNISKNDIAKRPLSTTNLNRFSSILTEIEQETKLNLKQIKQFIMDNIETLSYDKLLLIFKKDILPKLKDQKIKERIQTYFNSLDKLLFKNVKITANNIQVTADVALKIFQMYANAYNVSNKIEFKISENVSPIQDMMYIIKNNCNNCNIYLGYNSNNNKNNFSSIIQQLQNSMKTNNLVNNIIEYPIEQVFSINEKKVRNQCLNLQRNWFPDKISDVDFEEIKNLLNKENI